MNTGSVVLVEAVKLLRAADVPDAAGDARTLLAHAMGIDRGRLTLVLPERLEQGVEERFVDLIEKRCVRQPVSHLIGRRAFYGHDFKVTPQVLDPRPETEELVALVLTNPFETVLDLGVGSGCILLSLLAARNQATGVGGDLSAEALDVAAHNATQLKVEDRVSFVRSDWFSNIVGRFDVIVSNPPYISDTEMAELSPDVFQWEPHLALTPGGDGLSPYRILSERASEYLRPNGRLIVEIGHLQGPDVAAMFEAAGLKSVEIVKDLSGKNRIVSGING
ncbi:MAG: peptide chain release factor N(5)-glutamine methyltransferase [Pseudoruegeria sp.]